VGFLRRLLGGPDGPAADDGPADDRTDAEIEAAHELELARFEQARTTDLVRRQQQYSDKSWTPPAQGGTVRAGEEEAGEEETGGDAAGD
jgi:hypothetical protein